MGGVNGLSLESIEVVEENGKYAFSYFPTLHGKDEFILSKDRSGERVIGTENVNSKLEIGKEELEKLSYAYVFLKSGDKYGTPVRILTKSPSIRKILLQPEGKVKLVFADMNAYTARAGLEIKLTQGGSERGSARLEKGIIEFDLAQAGIAFSEKIKIGMQICFCMKDENQTAIFGPKSFTELVINPPAPMQIIRNERDIKLKLDAEPALPLYVRIYKDGQNIFGDIPSTVHSENEYVIATDTLNMTQGSYALSVVCMDEKTSSYVSEKFPIITERPVIQSISRRVDGCTIRMEEGGYYCWQEQCEWTDEIQISGSEVPEIRYADKCNSTVSLGLPARIVQTAQGGFNLKDGCYYRSDRKSDRPLAGEYKRYSNDSFTIKEDSGSWKLNIKAECKDTFEQDFKDLLSEECSTYAQIEELSACFGDMFLKTEDMLFVRYGYEPHYGACDIRAGMILCFDYTEYQNIPETNRKAEEGDTLSNRNLSGFVGNGRSMYHSILRDGKVTFEPFAHETVKKGYMTVDPPQIDRDGRISMGSGIWDTLFKQFGAGFVKLLYPSDWNQSGYLNHGSMYYYDNVCLVAADSYKELENAADSFRNKLSPRKSAAYVCFRGKTTVKLMIHIFLNGSPQICPLGTRLGDIVAAYGLSENVVLKRLYGTQYLPFINTDMNIPLYIGDQICSR